MMTQLRSQAVALKPSARQGEGKYASRTHTAAPVHLGHPGNINAVPGSWPSLTQTKPTISEPGDVYEQEADRVADQAMRMPDPTLSRSSIDSTPIRVLSIQRKSNSSHSGTPSSGFDAVTAPLSQSGRPLDASTRGFFEPRFGVDFGAVRIHTGTQAAESARAVNALAYTVGNDVVFNRGQYDPQSDSGKRLLAHELTHVVQQGGNENRGLSRISLPLQRSPLNVTEISDDITTGASTHPDLYSWLHVKGARSGEVAHAASTATTRAGPDPAPVPIDSSLPINAHFFPSFERHTDRRALIIGGFHGDERPGYEMADALVSELSSGPGYTLAFHTLIIPRLNLGAITDELAGAPGYDTRCNRQLVDLNRNFPSIGASHSSPRCRNTATAPVQPETQGVIDVIASFRPHRIISMHAISTISSAGVFADPNTHPSATALACSLASRLLDPSDRPANRLTSTSCNPVYPGDSAGALPSGGSLGRYGVRIDPHSQEITPVITLEAPGYSSLGTSGTGARTVEAFLQPLRAFITDSGAALNSEDAAILNDIRAFSLTSRRLFLTGRLPTGNSIYARISARINAQVTALNALVPRAPVSVRVVSQQRAFADPIGGTTPQSQLVFEKFTLTGSRAGGWDSLPDRYYVGGRRSGGVDRNAWLFESSATRLDTILRFSAVPGASRHHWGTEVDLNSTTSNDWGATTGRAGRPGSLFALGQWLQANASRVGFIQTYTAGRSAGHEEEPWHYSYAPIAGPLRGMFNEEVRLDQDIVDHIVIDWTARATTSGTTLPGDLRSAMQGLNLASYVNTIGSGL